MNQENGKNEFLTKKKLPCTLETEKPQFSKMFRLLFFVPTSVTILPFESVTLTALTLHFLFQMVQIRRPTRKRSISERGEESRDKCLSFILYDDGKRFVSVHTARSTNEAGTAMKRGIIR